MYLTKSGSTSMIATLKVAENKADYTSERVPH